MDTVIALLNIAVAVVLAVAVVRLSAAVNAVRQAWDQHELAHDELAHHAAGNPAIQEAPVWPVRPGLEIGQELDEEFAHLCEGWTLLVLLSRSCSICEGVLDGLEEVTRTLDNYRVALIADNDVQLPSGVRLAVVAPESLASLPTPAVVLVDSGLTIQGRGTVDSAADLLEFGRGQSPWVRPQGGDLDSRPPDIGRKVRASPGARGRPPSQKDAGHSDVGLREARFSAALIIERAAWAASL